jgi:SpoVK/Ycf46/Vps4 family AAA+-type ATPase
MFGYFLSWMQEKESAVYVFATANNASNLPPELKRKGRFDEIFCVNLPNEKEREEIFKVHLKKKGRSIEKIDCNQLAKETEGFNGADIESVVNEAMELCFLEKKELTTKIILEIAKDTKSISKSCRNQIEDMGVLFDENDFTNASDNPYWVLSQAEREKRKKYRHQNR